MAAIFSTTTRLTPVYRNHEPFISPISHFTPFTDLTDIAKNSPQNKQDHEPRLRQQKGRGRVARGKKAEGGETTENKKTHSQTITNYHNHTNNHKTLKSTKFHTFKRKVLLYQIRLNLNKHRRNHRSRLHASVLHLQPCCKKNHETQKHTQTTQQTPNAAQFQRYALFM